jgi:hypothetical protein
VIVEPPQERGEAIRERQFFDLSVVQAEPYADCIPHEASCSLPLLILNRHVAHACPTGAGGGGFLQENTAHGSNFRASTGLIVDALLAAADRWCRLPRLLALWWRD